jgi:hypothetical protein
MAALQGARLAALSGSLRPARLMAALAEQRTRALPEPSQADPKGACALVESRLAEPEAWPDARPLSRRPLA